MTQLKTATKAHQRQHDQSDCGPACLLSALRYHAASVPLERLREWSGTSTQGTTLLGLLQAARQVGFEADGYEADLQSLQECPDLCILHVVKDQHLQHFILCYGYDAQRAAFLVSDPAEPQCSWLTNDELLAIWQSKALLLLKSSEKLPKISSQQLNQRRWFWELVREDVPILAVALVLGLLTSILGLALALFSQQLVDQIIPQAEVQKLFLGGGLLMALLLARAGLGYVRQVLLLRQSQDMNLRLAHNFYERLLHLSKPFFDNRKTGDLIARLNDTQRIQRTVAALAGGALIDVLSLLTALGFMFFYSWQLGVAGLLWLPLFLAVVWRFHPAILQQQRQTMSAYAFTESHYIDSIQGVGAIKIGNRQAVFARLTQGIFGVFQQRLYQLGLTGARFGLAAEAVGTLFLAGVIAWSGWQTLQGQMSTGGLIALLQMAATLVASAAQLSSANLLLQEARVAFDRMFEFAALETEYEMEAEAPKATIQAFEELRVENLAFRFPGRKRLLEDLSFQLRRGEWISILGESGCGKSTLLQILQKFYAAESGHIKVNGIDLTLLGYENWRAKLGVVPQNIKLFNGTLLDNILLGEEVKNPEALQAFFEHYGFDAYFSQFPNGYLTLLGEEGVNLSGGQQQLVALARALYRQPELLLLDEPTAALDRDTEQFVLQLLEQLKSQVGIVVLTHRLRTARAADRMYVIEQGRIVASGQHEGLLQQDNLYRRAWYDLVGAEMV
jgi:ATP-binding cassette subfamily B protein